MEPEVLPPLPLDGTQAINGKATASDPHLVIAASPDADAIKYAERWSIVKFGPAQHIRVNPGQDQQVQGIHTALALGQRPAFLRAFVEWPTRYAAEHIDTPARAVVNGTATIINGLTNWWSDPD